jgi:hypothetical protein
MRLIHKNMTTLSVVTKSWRARRLPSSRRQKLAGECEIGHG